MQARAALRRFFTGADRSGQPSERILLHRLFWTGFLVRLAFLTFAHTYRFRTEMDHFPFGWEMGRIARSLVLGEGYSSPFGGHTGPTAWTPPLYPLLMALYFRLFGIYSHLAAWFLLATNCIFSALTAPLIVRIAQRCYGDPAHPSNRTNSVALWSGWLWALYPAAMQYAVHWPWDMALTACFFSYALLAGLQLRGIGGPSSARRAASWAGWGLAWALIALANSSLLSFFPFQTLWILWPYRRRLREVLAPALAGFLLIALALGGWALRNQRAFHTFVPLRANFGVELYMSVLPSHEGFPRGNDIPAVPGTPEFQRYARLGELRYSKELGREAKLVLAEHPWRSLDYVLLRFQFYWAGVPHPFQDHGVASELFRELNYSALSVTGLLGLALSLRRRIPAAGIFAVAFAVIPVIYYLITVQARFRSPLEPLITIFSVYLFQSADRTRLFSFGQPRPLTARAAA